MEFVRIIYIGIKVVALSIGGLALLISNMQGNLPGILALIAIIIFAGGEIYKIIYWRCPDCRKLLPPYEIFEIKICPYCGCHLNEK